MTKARVLFVSQEITPYLPESNIAKIGRNLPQGIQERGKEIRTFMPRYGCVNERRNQLHEVIRLSGMNLIINNEDHPLIIKVASIQPARMQVYFIDNEEFFRRKAVLRDEKGKYFEDNDERSVFFCRGVLETIKKLGWAPDIIHCHGWMTAALPLYLKKNFRDDPIFENSKIVYSVYDEGAGETLGKDYWKKVMLENVSEGDMEVAKHPSIENLHKLAIESSDAIIVGSPNLNEEMTSYISENDKPKLEFQTEDAYMDAYSAFYDEMLENSNVMAE